MQLKSKISLTITFLLLGIYLAAQTNKSVGIGTTTPDNSAVLQLESNNQGFMMPHLTNTQIITIASPMNGLIVYSTTDSCYWFYKANHWDKICGTQHIISNYISTDTLISNTATINTINADSIISNYINTHYIHSDTVIASYGNITYLTTDTFISNQATINELNTDTIFSNYIHSNTISTNTITAGVGSFDTLLINGQSINNVITNEIDTTAWLLKGNSGTNAAINFLGTKDSMDLVLRTNNRERVRIKADSGNVGINTSAPTNDLDVNGGIRMRPGAALNYVMLSDAIGNGTWQNPVGTVITPGNLNGTAWDLIGNTGTNPTINFLGTSDSLDVVFRTNNRERMRILANKGFIGVNTTSPTSDLDINGGIRIRPGAALNYLLLSDANGNGTWQNPVSVLTPTNLNTGAWTILGNTGTNPTINFLGTTDAQPVMLGVNNTNFGRLGYVKYTTGWTAQNLILFDGGLFNDAQNTCSSFILGRSNSYNTVYATALNTYLDSCNMIVGNRIHYSENTNVKNNNGNGYNFLMGNNMVLSDLGNFNFIFGYDLSIQNPTWNFGSNNFIEGQKIFMTGAYSYGNVIFGGAGNGKYINGQQIFFVDESSNTKTVSNLANDVVLCANSAAVTTSLPYTQYSFLGMFTNGYQFYSNDALTAGVKVAPGGGAWASISDRNLKENIKDLNYHDVLQKINSIPVTEWSYISQRPDTVNKFKTTPLHIGPMAQDFNSVFNYGEYDKMITSSDIDGVLFAAVKALSINSDKSTEEISNIKKVETQDVEKINQLENTIADLKKYLDEVKAAMEELKKK